MRMPDFKRRMEWFIENRPDLTENMASMRDCGHERADDCCPLWISEQLRCILKYMLDEKEFLSPYGIRALSRFHRDHPYMLHVNGMNHRVDYEPAESIHRTVRRQFQLARPDLVPRELFAGRVTAEVSSLLWRRFQGRVPHRLGENDDTLGSGGRIVAPA